AGRLHARWSAEALLRETAREAHSWRRRAQALADELELTQAAQDTAAALGARAVAAAIAAASCAAGGAPIVERPSQLATEAREQAAEVQQAEQPVEAPQALLVVTQAARPEIPYFDGEVSPVRIVVVPQVMHKEAAKAMMHNAEAACVAQERIVEVPMALQAEQPVGAPLEPPAWLEEFAEQAVEVPTVHIVECVIELRTEVRRQLHSGAKQRAGVALAALLGLLLRLAEAVEALARAAWSGVGLISALPEALRAAQLIALERELGVEIGV
ncbi:unnamed protein product, partial [Prorocentrum cordatum]